MTQEPDIVERLQEERLAFAIESEERRAEIERLLAQVADLAFTASERADEIERLRAALEAIEHETGMTMLATNHGRRGNKANAIARAALVAYVRGLENELDQLRTLLKAAAYHVKGAGDVSLLTMIRAALEPKS